MKNIISTVLAYAITISFIAALLTGTVISAIGGATGQHEMQELGFLLAIAPVFLSIMVGIPALMIVSGEQFAKENADYGW